MKTRKTKFLVVAVVIMVLTMLSLSVYAVNGGLDGFLARHNPSFGEFAIAPLEPAYALDQDIRIEVIGAQQVSNVVLMYIAIQDTSGENRLSSHSFPDIFFIVNGEIISGPSTSRRLNFDESTNTIYLESRMAGEAGMPRADTLELLVDRIYCPEATGEHYGQLQTLVAGEWRMIVNTSDLGIEPIVWTDIQIGGLHLEYMSLSPFGLQVVGNGTINGGDFFHSQTAVELTNRRRNIRFTGRGGRGGQNGFSYFFSLDAPIDIDVVTAVIIDGVRIPVENSTECE